MIVVPAFPVLSLLAAVIVLGGAAGLAAGGRLTAARVITLIVVAGYTAGVLSETLFPLRLELSAIHERLQPPVNLTPISTIDQPTFSLNVIMLMPFGFLYPLLSRSASWLNALRWGAAISLAIEGSQFAGDLLFDTGRLADVNDVIANTAGAVLGYAVFQVVVHTPGLGAVLRRAALTSDRVAATGRASQPARSAAEPSMTSGRR